MKHFVVMDGSLPQSMNPRYDDRTFDGQMDAATCSALAARTGWLSENAYGEGSVRSRQNRQSAS